MAELLLVDVGLGEILLVDVGLGEKDDDTEVLLVDVGLGEKDDDTEVLLVDIGFGEKDDDLDKLEEDELDNVLTEEKDDNWLYEDDLEEEDEPDTEGPAEGDAYSNVTRAKTPDATFELSLVNTILIYGPCIIKFVPLGILPEYLTIVFPDESNTVKKSQHPSVFNDVIFILNCWELPAPYTLTEHPKLFI